ncbi:MAG: hypothetical protein PHY42_06550 [Bacilli bacterium]|nr:hypothetical protein [Bacilli bacterium]
MKKIFSLIALVLLTLAIVGCTPKEEERTYKADGVYVAWELSTNQATLYLADGSSFKNAENATVKVTAPVLSLVRVEIRNDEIVDFYIDEIQSKATATVNAENALDITAVSFAFNAQSKKELEYSYGMEKNGKLGEWFIQATIIENNWLTSGVVAELPAASATITHDNYVTLANEAIQKAIDGKVSAVYAETNCVHFVEGDIDEEGKISDVSLDAHYFNYIDKSTDQYDETNVTKYLVFAWDAESKYESYPEMLPGKSWQTMIDTLVSYINTNGWDGTLLSGYYKDVSGTPTYQAGKGLNINDVNVEALASVTITVSNQVLVMNMLWKYFPEGWTE